ncbi:MAG TPA: hypothetical protein VFM70_10755 [Salinimicrobium sp.]|nr:hypothetical protein [Salinimicrobium sp.]
MKFKVLRSSETGNKISIVEKKANEANEAARQLSKEIGFDRWRGGYWCAFGGVSCVMFKNNPPNPKLWKKQEDGFFPKKNSKDGKELAEKFENLPSVGYDELNKTIDFDGAPWKHIGINFNNDKFFGFVVGDDWDYEPNEDCEEITVSEYKRLFS